MIRLFDVNVLVALVWPPHVHHEVALDLFTRVEREGWATCPITQLGTMRVLARPATSLGTLTMRSANDRLRGVIAHERHIFWPDSIDATPGPFQESLPHLQGPGQLTDRYLLALATANRGVLVTFDASIDAALPVSSPLRAHLEVVGTDQRQSLDRPPG